MLAVVAILLGLKKIPQTHVGEENAGQINPAQAQAHQTTFQILTSGGVLLILSVLLYNGFLLGSLTYLFPIIMIDQYQW
jgi:hypothetical protein